MVSHSHEFASSELSSGLDNIERLSLITVLSIFLSSDIASFSDPLPKNTYSDNDNERNPMRYHNNALH